VNTPLPYLLPLIALLGAPLMMAVIARTRCRFAGRQGPPLLQPYRDLRKLFARGAVYSETSTWLFRLGPVVNLSAVLGALVLVPLGGVPAPLSFSGDMIVVAGLLGLGNFLTLLAALDTGSSFEGMGASREAHFAALAEPSLFLALAALVRVTGETSLSEIYTEITPGLWAISVPVLALASVSLLLLSLVENTQMPIDDPTTHLELTMIHEVMVLDHSGPDLGLIHYGAALKMWLLGALVVGIAVPLRTGNLYVDALGALAGLFLLAVVVGSVASLMARLKLTDTPRLILTAGALSIVALLMELK